MAQPNLQFQSYPPLFRPPNSPTQEPGLEERPISSPEEDPLPVIDMQCLDIHKLDEASRNWGIFRLVNHGVPIRLLRELQEHAKRIFDLPFESKQGLGGSNRSPIKYFWGTPALTISGVALPRGRASGGSDLDWVEGLNVPLGQLSSLSIDYDDPLVNSFSNMLEEYRGHLTRLASTLFEAMMRRLKLDLQLPKTYLDESSELVRAYRYPSCSDMVDHLKGMHVHTDSSVLSILNEDQVGGLQFLKDDVWLDVKPIPNSLVVNLGDMMQALSDDEYKSVKHRVKLNKHKERVSICYFVFPEENSLIQSSKYKPFTYTDFRAQVQQDIKTLGSKIGLPSFKLSQVI